MNHSLPKARRKTSVVSKPVESKSKWRISYMQQVQVALQNLRGCAHDALHPLILMDKDVPVPPMMKVIGDAVEASSYPPRDYRQVSLPKQEIETILSQYAERINDNDKMGQTALHLAVQYCSPAAVQRLLDAGALASVRDVDGLTPTHYAAMAGKVDNLKLLPEGYLATPDDKSNRLPIHYAAMCGRCGVLTYLLQNTISMDSQDSYGNTALVLASRYGHPEAAQILIEAGADGKLTDHDDIPGIALVNQQYIKLGSQMLDRYVSCDDFTNRVEIKIKPIIERKTKSQRTFYHNLVTCNSAEESTDHYVICNITAKKWDLFAKKYFTMFITSIMIFNIFWTIIYTWPHEHEEQIWFLIMAGVLALFGLTSIIMHTMALFLVTYKKKKFYDSRVKAIHSSFNYEKTHLHYQQYNLVHQLKNVKTQVLGHYKIRNDIIMMVFNFIRNILLLLYLINKILTFVNEDVHGAESHVIALDIAISLVILTVWMQLFNALGISSTVGRFVVFTKEVIRDIASVFIVYMSLFIPMTVIFWKTIYSHSKDGDGPTWYNTPFNVLRMTMVDYDYDLGRKLARSVGIDLWWDILSLTWLILSGLIILNLFIALMADRYARLGDRSTSICNKMRANFVFSCELLMGQKRVDEWEDIIIKNYGVVTCENTDNNSEQMEKDISSLQDKLEEISSKLDRVLEEKCASRKVSEKMTVEDLDTSPVSDECL